MKTVIYSFQRGLQFLQKTFREFGGEEEDIQQLTNTKLFGRKFKVSIVYI